MNEKQAVKFWNAIQGGEIIGFVPDTEVCQGGPIEKPTYTSAICDQFDLPGLIVPRASYDHMGAPRGTVNPNKEQAKEVASFLRMMADKIELASTIKFQQEIGES